MLYLQKESPLNLLGKYGPGLLAMHLVLILWFTAFIHNKCSGFTYKKCNDPGVIVIKISAQPDLTKPIATSVSPFVLLKPLMQCVIIS